MASWIIYLKELHRHNHLKFYLLPLAFLFFFIAVSQAMGKGFRVFPCNVPMSAGKEISLLHCLVFHLNWMALSLLAFSGYLFFYNKIQLMRLFFGDMERARGVHLGAGVILVLTCMVKEAYVPRYVPPQRYWPEAALTGILALSGTLLFFRERFGLAVKYGLAVAHSGLALIFISLLLAFWYRKTFLRSKPG